MATVSVVVCSIDASTAPLHLLAEGSRPAVVALALYDLPRNLVQDYRLPQLVDVPGQTLVRICLSLEDILHVVQEALNGRNERFVCGSRHELQWLYHIRVDWPRGVWNDVWHEITRW
jgi:hypothetical protein